ncbi:MAG TPA: DUF3293 domain-containing protein [Burkholderiales bacterium]|nr:DUF3293 domain-containing protein [Burkholderiales bacterium]
MPIDPALRAAYRAARYIVYHDGREVVMQVGALCPELDALLEDEGGERAAFLTPYNPRGVPQHEDQNLQAMADLIRALERMPYDWHLGEGNDPGGEWPHEPSLLIVGIPLEEARALGERFGQLAIVYIERGGPAELVELA